MQIGMVGLGKMGGNMSRRLMKAGHQCVVFARTAASRDAVAKDGASAAVSLADAQRNVVALGAIEERFAGDVRPPTEEEPLDPTWRPILASDPFEAPDDSAPWPEDATVLYYWRPTFWRAKKPDA